jgi:hypothetical protein
MYEVYNTLFESGEISPEKEDEIIRKVAERIHRFGLNIATIVALKSIRPFVFIGGEMGRYFISPFLPVLGENIGLEGDLFFRIFEKRTNVEKLTNLLEEMMENDEMVKREKQKTKKKNLSKQGWRRFLPL